MNEFWQQVRGRLTDEERSIGWLARRLGITRSALNNYLHGYRPTPEHIRRAVAVLLDIRAEKIAA